MAVWGWIVAVAALVGAIAGSFLNVCIVRLPRGESVVSPRSRCVMCGHAVRWFDNIPVLSYVLLRGRCRDCGARISWQYPAVELATALWFALCFVAPARFAAAPSLDVDLVFGALAAATSLSLLGFFLLGLAVMDAQTGLLPNEFTIGGLCVGLFFTATESFFLPPVRTKTFLTPEEVFIFQRLGAAIAGWLILWSIGAAYKLIRKRPGMGGGDAKMLAMIGAFLGFGNTLLAFLFGVAVAACAGVFLLLRRRAGGATRLPFGTFLAAGGLVSALAGPRIVDWYTGLFR